MKVSVTFKSPDGVTDSIRAAAEAEVTEFDPTVFDSLEQAIDTKVQEIEELLKPWIKWGEYATIEFDTDAQTATVVKEE